MRIALTALLAFAAGVLLTLLVHRAAPALAAHHDALPAAAATVAKAAPAVASSAELPAPATEDEADRWPEKGSTPEQVAYAQPRMLREAIAKLGPRVAGTPNLYLVAFAGDGGEDVFHNEVEYAGKLFADRFGATVHPLLLANSPDTLETRPLATWSNLESTLDALSGVMNKNEDILVLYLTSHGDPDHNLLVDMDPLPLDQIGAPDLAGILAKHPFKWKVVVVNACYSGGFVPPLKGPGTLVLTAARADRSSFGCGSDSDITYFGRAWLVDAMNRTADFIAGFQQAKAEIAQWETRDHLTPSEPQIDVGAGIADQLARWRGHVKPGAAVAFEPSHVDVAPAAR
ncbi:caspase family protein [Dyella sp. LX-66]|uniref:C13 family peptidase n=1 Tax=unclassified Dyella TaxID=2634549 RepID=UPI001BDFA323|nr:MULTISPECIES: C13 family peptidase [unclassified Dyella]MBT2116815.1 caspase family protein [Dyella sp. LX-1]MBT2139005.1 caspase family protein [Dyella sp. LX-66]